MCAYSISKLKIMFWNSQSLRSKIPELSKFVNSNKIDVILISETWLNESVKIHLPNFICYRKDRDSNSRNPHGGVCILIRKGIKHSLVNSIRTLSIENVFIKIPFRNSFLLLGSIYSPPSVSIDNFKSDFIKLFTTSFPTIIAGDINAKHQYWNNSKTDSKGRELLQLANHHLFEIHIPSEPTLIPAIGKPSTVDLAFSKNLHCISNLLTVNDLSSDHLPVKFEVNSEFPSKFDKIFDFPKADWQKFRSIISEKLSAISEVNIQNSDNDSVDLKIKKFSDLVKNAANNSIPKKKPYFFRYPSSEQIDNFKKYRNMYRTLYIKTNNPSFKSCVNQLNRMIKNATETINKNSWEDKISKMSHKDNSVFQLAKYFKNKKRSTPPMKKNDELVYSDKDKANLLAENFKKVHVEAASLRSPHDSKISDFISNFNSSEFSVNEDDLFQEELVLRIISNLRTKKACGPDGISNILIKNLPNNAISFLTGIFNECLKLGYFPKAWKVARVVAIPKPNKDPTLASNYRPISLLNCVGKVFEALILTKLLEYADDNSILINQQFGFRYGHSTVQQILRLIEEISFDFNKDISSGLVLLDIEKAFDSVWHAGLLYKMAKYKYPKILIKIVQSFLSDRTSYIQVNDEISFNYSTTAGVPQGAKLSPHLFNIFINDIPTPPNCTKAIFADDTAIKTTSGPHGMSIIKKNLENGLKVVSNYFKSWKIKVNKPKTEALLLSHSRILSSEIKKPQNRIKFEDCFLEWKKSIKYLGVILDPRLTFRLDRKY